MRKKALRRAEAPPANRFLYPLSRYRSLQFFYINEANIILHTTLRQHKVAYFCRCPFTTTFPILPFFDLQLVFCLYFPSPLF